jgi:LmbE family N-acetylglucosaminyl deacetylase
VSQTRRLRSLVTTAVILVLILCFLSCVSLENNTDNTSTSNAVDLDVLYVGAHPDDETSSLSTLGQLVSDHRLRAGVVTITRGEGGGNAVGTEEGPALGLLREAEERRAIGKVGLTEVFNLDKADFYYTVSSSLTEQVWGHQDTLAKLVRVIRHTRPKIVITMDPSPQPGNHGNHQFAARLAIEAYTAAADSTAFPEQISTEHLHPWAVSRLFLTGMRGERMAGPDCEKSLHPRQSTDQVYAVWGGRSTRDGGDTWAQRERRAQWEYVTQGWANLPDAPSSPTEINCDYFTEIASRVPHPSEGKGPDAMLHGALIAVPAGLPLGTGLTATPTDFRVAGGADTTIRVVVTAPPRTDLPEAVVKLRVPPGWEITGSGNFGTVRSGQSASVKFTVTAAAGARPGRVRLPVELTSLRGNAQTTALLEITAPVQAETSPLPQVAEFQQWALRTGNSALADAVPPVATLPSGGRRALTVLVHNYSAATQSGAVSIELPRGFSAPETAQPFSALAPGWSTTVTFSVTNTDPTLPTGMLGGDYPYSITARPEEGAASSSPAVFELVPLITVPQAGVAPIVDGVAGPGEYPGKAMNVSSLWEGEKCATVTDCSPTAVMSWHGDALYALINVTDDVAGSKLKRTDCKRHWRTDSVELTIDPRGNSEDTSTTVKLAVLPITDDPPGNSACYFRDADNHQGAGPQTAPGVTVTSRMSEPYTGYTIELAIPLDILPTALNPQHAALNLFVYDSDTQDKTGQTRIGWSTWGGVQGDPYRWGLAHFEGYTPPAGRPTKPPTPVLPLTALSSLDSPQSIDQAARTGIPLGSSRAARQDEAAWASQAITERDGVSVTVQVNGPGIAHLFVVDAAAVVLGQRTVPVSPGRPVVVIPVTHGQPATVLMGFVTQAGATTASVKQIS